MVHDFEHILHRNPEVETVISELISSLGAAGGLFSGFGNLVSLAVWAVTAYCLYSIAQRRNIRHAWMAWVPVLQLWTLGCISDQYQLLSRNNKTSRRKALIGVKIAQAVVVVLLAVMAIGAILAFLSAGYTGYDDVGDWLGIFGTTGGLILLGVLAGGLGIVETIVRYVAFYDVYRSCEPGNATLYLVLSIFIRVTEPIFLWMCFRKDEGICLTTPVEPWENA